MKSYFFEDLDNLNYEIVKERALKNQQRKDLVIHEEDKKLIHYTDFDIIYNFTLANIAREAYSPLL